MSFTLRDYQQRCVQKSIGYINDPKNNKPQVLVAPTAAGKSLIIAAIAKEIKRPVLVLQPSKELLVQNHAKYISYGLHADIYSASVGQKTLGEVTFATLGSIKNLAEDFKFIGVDTVIIDECHYKFPPEKGKPFRNFIDQLKPKKVIGLTATPFYLRPSSAGSALKMITRVQDKYFKEFLDIIQIPELTSRGFWSPLEYIRYKFDEEGLELNSTGSEFTEESIKKVMEERKINNNICLEIKRLQEDGIGSILVFVDSLETARTMSGWHKLKDATYISSDMPKKDRDERVQGFKSGKYKVLCNYGILTTGFDFPDLRCVIMGRPTMSLSLYYQIIGRLTRISPETDKTHGLFVDFCGNTSRFGKVENLIIEEVEGEGMCLTSGDIVLTGYPIAGLLPSKQSLKKGFNKDMQQPIPFGKHQGTRIIDLPVGYMTYLLNLPTFGWNGKKMQGIRTAFLEVLALHEENKKKLQER